MIWLSKHHVWFLERVQCISEHITDSECGCLVLHLRSKPLLRVDIIPVSNAIECAVCLLGEVFDSSTLDSPQTPSTNGDVFQDMVTPTRPRTTEDLFAAIHRYWLLFKTIQTLPNPWSWSDLFYSASLSSSFMTQPSYLSKIGIGTTMHHFMRSSTKLLIWWVSLSKKIKTDAL